MRTNTQQEQEEVTIDQAERILRKRYWDDVRRFAEDLAFEIEQGNIENAEQADEWLWETMDSCQRVIYTHLCLDGLRWSDNADAAYDELGSEGLIRDGNIHWSGIMFIALRADVMEHIGDLEEFVDEHLPKEEG